ncbi:MAG: hypothetical protein K6F49_03075 [Saccharofermentans sp.]|nr:hypothetical protein [Saccharofermentans sp.]
MDNMRNRSTAVFIFWLASVIALLIINLYNLSSINSAIDIYTPIEVERSALTEPESDEVVTPQGEYIGENVFDLEQYRELALRKKTVSEYWMMGVCVYCALFTTIYIVAKGKREKHIRLYMLLVLVNIVSVFFMPSMNPILR